MASCSATCGPGRAGRPQAAAISGTCPRYGVRSYLHHFYEECTTSIWERDEDFQIQRSPSRWNSVLWKVFLALGALILTTGVTVLTVGYATTPRIEAFGEEHFLFVDSRAIRFNKALEACKVAGAALFCVGGAMTAAGLLLSAVAKDGAKEERGLHWKSRSRASEPITAAPTLGESKIPVTLSKVQNVQPTSGT